MTRAARLKGYGAFIILNVRFWRYFDPDATGPRYRWRTTCGKAGVYRRPMGGSTFIAYAQNIESGDKETIKNPKTGRTIRFRTLDNALKAAARAYHL